jgi:Flp pilus assembly protein TadG
MIEAALVLLVFLSFFLGMVDLGIIVFRQHVVSPAARQGARRAIVHGSLAKSTWEGGPWGPVTYGPTAANSADPQAQAIAPYLTALDPSRVQVTMQWLNNDNGPEDRVRVTVTTTTTTIIGFILGGQTISLTASSTMPIAH